MWSYRRILLDKDLAAAKHYMKGTVLDVGGGRKRGDFREPEGVKWLTLDSNPELKPDILADAGEIPLPPQSVDCVKCTELLEHVEYPEKVLAEIARVLKLGGVLVLSVPFNVNIHSDPHDYQRLTDQKLKNMLSGDFDNISVKKQGLFFTVLAYMIKQAIYSAKMRLRFCFWFLRPLLDLLVKLDNTKLVINSKFMSSFTTGFFVVAVRK
ncbi:methyltransferase domain-containing protein [Chloroflexota bacterium]